MRKNRVTTCTKTTPATIDQRLREQGYEILDVLPLIFNLDFSNALLQTNFRNERGLGSKLDQCYLQRNADSYTLVMHWFRVTAIADEGEKGLGSNPRVEFDPYQSAAAVTDGQFVTVNPDYAEIVIWVPKELIPMTEEPPSIEQGNRDLSAVAGVDVVPQ